MFWMDLGHTPKEPEEPYIPLQVGLPYLTGSGQTEEERRKKYNKKVRDRMEYLFRKVLEQAPQDPNMEHFYRYTVWENVYNPGILYHIEMTDRRLSQEACRAFEEKHDVVLNMILTDNIHRKKYRIWPCCQRMGIYA
jgi:hypothetical protein